MGVAYDPVYTDEESDPSIECTADAEVKVHLARIKKLSKVFSFKPREGQATQLCMLGLLPGNLPFSFLPLQFI